MSRQEILIPRPVMVIALLKMTAKKYGQTIVMITHDDEIAQVADRILVIEDGQVVDFR